MTKTVRMSRSKVKGVTPDEWRRIASEVEKSTTLEAHALAASAGVSREMAMAVMARLVGLGAAKMYLLIYHAGEETPFATVPHANGLPGISLPHRCAVCDREIEDTSELRYDAMARINPGAKIVWNDR